MADWFGGKMGYVGHEVKHGLLHMVHGMKTLAMDGKWVVKQKVKSQG